MTQQEFMDLMSGAGFGGFHGITNWGQLSDPDVTGSSNIAMEMAQQYGIPSNFFSDQGMTGMFNPLSESRARFLRSLRCNPFRDSALHSTPGARSRKDHKWATG